MEILVFFYLTFTWTISTDNSLLLTCPIPILTNNPTYYVVQHAIYKHICSNLINNCLHSLSNTVYSMVWSIARSLQFWPQTLFSNFNSSACTNLVSSKNVNDTFIQCCVLFAILTLIKIAKNKNSKNNSCCNKQLCQDTPYDIKLNVTRVIRWSDR